MTDRTAGPARLVTNVLNPFVIFTALYVLVAFARTGSAVLYVVLELLAAAVVAGYVLLMRRRKRVGDFWISTRAERLLPAVVLLVTFAALLGALALSDAPWDLFLLTLSMGLANAAVAGLLMLGPPGLVFLFALPPVVWSRVTLTAHTVPQVLAGAGIGAAFALLVLT